MAPDKSSTKKVIQDLCWVAENMVEAGTNLERIGNNILRVLHQAEMEWEKASK